MTFRRISLFVFAGASFAACSNSGTPSTEVDAKQTQVSTQPVVSVSEPFPSHPFRDLPLADGWTDREGHEPGRNPHVQPHPPELDPVVQSKRPVMSMPASLHDFLGEGATLGGCVFPKPDGGEPSTCVTIGDPPDTVGAVGPNHYVQMVNGGIAVWNKSGTLIHGPVFTSSLWTGFPTTDGNNCASSPADGGDWGDGVVLYDQLADRWVMSQFDITNFVDKSTGPSYECVAVSQTSDPTGAYSLYDFQYPVAINDYPKLSTWNDGYYASFNEFNPSFVSANLCAYDRTSMLQGLAATQICFQSSDFGFLPSNVDGPIAPPRGEPAFFVNLPGGPTVGLYKFHADFTTPSNSTFTGPTNLTVAAYNEMCGGGNCVTQPSPGNPLASLGDRPMFHLSYRNFGSLESLVFTHSVAANTTGGIRWYEIRSPNATPAVAQQGTYAPNDGNYRWMGSMSQDQAQDMALGFSLSGTSTFPTVAWTGRLASDTAGQMGQAEGVVQAGTGVETGNFSNGQAAERWGDYSNMQVDPSDDCTFWYTQELYPANGIFNWDTRIASVAFPSCAANDFTLQTLPATGAVAPGGTTAFSVNTALKAGSAEAIALFVQDLPSGVAGAFAPQTVDAGQASTLTLTASGTAPRSGLTTFTVIGKAASAVHAATAQVAVAPSPTVALTSPPDGGTLAGLVAVTATGIPAAGTTLSSLAISVDGVAAQSGSSSPLTYNWDTTQTTNGAHALGATATDVDFGSASTGIAVTVMNPPSVTFASPDAGAALSGSASLSAVATAPLGTSLASLSISIDGTGASSSATSPDSYAWDTTAAANGMHALVATAVDGDGTHASAPLSVSVANPPTVAVTSPASGATLQGTVSVVASATPPNGTSLSQVVILVDGQTAAMGASPLTYSWNTTQAANGMHALSANATDADGTNATSATVAVTVNNPVPDAGSGGTDAGPRSDAGTGGVDSGSPRPDSGTGGADSGSGGSDSGGPAVDGGTSGTSAGSGCGCGAGPSGFEALVALALGGVFALGPRRRRWLAR